MPTLPTEEQTMLRDTLAEYLRDREPASGGAWPSDTERLASWRALASDLGILAAPFPENYGGLGGGFAEHLIILEELGRALSGEPYLSTAVFGGSLLKQCPGTLASSLVPRIIAGDCIVAIAHLESQSRYNALNIDTALSVAGSGRRLSGRKIMVDVAPWATQILVTARSHGKRDDVEGISLVVLDSDTPGMRRRDFRTIDGIAASELEFPGTPIDASRVLGPEGKAGLTLLLALDQATLGACAEALGVLRRMLDDTVEYTRQRRQFGRPLADFQVLQHRMVDMYVELEQATAITLMAAEQLTEAPDTRAQAVSAAKWLVGRASRSIAEEAVQIHGAIGTTDEIALSRYFKRAIAFESRFGSGDHHLQRYIALMKEEEL